MNMIFPVLFLLCIFSYAQGQPLPHIKTGVAEGYVADQVCGDCHASHFESYQEVGMSQSFKSPGNARKIEDFGEIFFHEPSARYYQMLRRNDRIVFRRFQRDDTGDVINELEIPVDWVLGSGNRTRSYLYQTEHGELFQLPIGWYSEGGFWEMSPGFESPDHQGVSRQVTRKCLFCHNAFPEIENDRYGDPERFPHDLPEGTGCQRCHGPGGEHVTTALTSGDLDAIRSLIINPRKLTGEVRDSVCMQCHLLPSISLVTPLKFGQGEMSFRPGNLLSEFVAQLDVREVGVVEQDRFEINHHGYRLMKSECYQQGGLSCIDCHNPHVKPDSNVFREKVAGICLDCHEGVTHQEAVSEAACVSCHMPTRRTQDVIHVTMTDHWIARGPFDPAKLVAPRKNVQRAVSDIQALGFGEDQDLLDNQAYIAIAAMRSGRSTDDAVRSLIDVLRKREYDHYTPYLDLAQTWLKQGKYQQAESAARGLVGGEQSLGVAYNILGISQLALGKLNQAKLSFRRSLELSPEPEVHLALGSVYFETNQLSLAEIELDKAISLRPLMAEAFRMKGRIAMAQGNARKAAVGFERSLQINPGHIATYALIAEALKISGDSKEAQRFRELERRLTQ